MDRHGHIHVHVHIHVYMQLLYSVLVDTFVHLVITGYDVRYYMYMYMMYMQCSPQDFKKAKGLINIHNTAP